jgi:hypothetical protein
VLFGQRFWRGIQDGSITCTFRRWRRPQVLAGRRYRTPAGRIEVDSVEAWTEDAITAHDVAAAGYASTDDLVGDLRPGEDRTLYRIRFHAVDGPDPRDVLAADAALGSEQRAEIDRRLDRLDRASGHGPWTRATLAAIAARPGTRAADLAAGLGRERAPFKLDVRKLKAMGLTLSLDVGYRLSPRGEAYLVGRGPGQPDVGVS